MILNIYPQTIFVRKLQRISYEQAGTTDFEGLMVLIVPSFKDTERKKALFNLPLGKLRTPNVKYLVVLHIR